MQYHISADLDWPIQKQTGRRLRYFSSQFKCVQVHPRYVTSAGDVGGGMINEAIAHGVSVVAGNDPATWVDEHGDVLYRYALARVRKPDVAQDLVQE
ncbi:MAG: hypothetical protein DME41_11275, partial [Verrucomicrobia bacterium]